MPAKNAKLTLSNLPFSIRQRLEHIERCLLWKGELQRADLMERFGVNPAQAATDFSAYMQIAPDNMSYDKSRKRYVPLPEFSPALIEPTSLDEFMEIKSPVIDVEQWPIPPRSASSATLQAIVKAIRCREAVEVCYQSMTDPRPSWRWLSPHAFASDGERWHVRAFCHVKEDFRDFVLGRITSTRGTRPTEVTSDQDRDWHTFLTIVIKPNPQLSDDQRAAIAAEYNMQSNHEMTLRLRKSMMFYLMARFSSVPNTAAVAHQLVFLEKNQDESSLAC